MQIGLIGLGKMGKNLALNMRDNGFDIRVSTRNKDKLAEMDKEGIKSFETVEELVASLEKPRVIWIMITAGDPVENMIERLIPLVDKDDIIIDGGNSRFRDTLRRGDMLEEKGIKYVDAGTSGGIFGARNGACMMIGADQDVFDYLEPVFKACNVEDGYLHCGRRGSGHYVKMVHNGIEYGMMQAIGEGFEILDKSEFDLDFEKVANVWNNGSIIEGYLMEKAKDAFNHNGDLEEIEPVIDYLGEGQWTVEEAIRLEVPAPVITNALFVRYATKDHKKYSDKVVAALRNEFGGHKLHKK